VLHWLVQTVTRVSVFLFPIYVKLSNVWLIFHIFTSFVTYFPQWEWLCIWLHLVVWFVFRITWKYLSDLYPIFWLFRHWAEDRLIIFWAPCRGCDPEDLFWTHPAYNGCDSEKCAVNFVVYIFHLASAILAQFRTKMPGLRGDCSRAGRFQRLTAMPTRTLAGLLNAYPLWKLCTLMSSLLVSTVIDCASSALCLESDLCIYCCSVWKFMLVQKLTILNNVS